MVQIQGLVEQVETLPARSFATADAAVSDAVVYVEDASQFQTSSGTCTVEISGVQYSAEPTVDKETFNDFLTVDPPLSVAITGAQPVALIPAAEVKWAWVSVSDDAEQDLMKCRVPLSLKGYTSLADGPRSGDEREAVQVETEPEPTIVDPPNQRTLFSAAVLDPETTVPPEALTDGDAPSGSPTPTLEPFAIGGLRWSVAPVANADPVRFRVYADTVDPPTIDAAHLVDDTASLFGTFAAIDDVRLLPDDPNAALPSYYVACVEYDADGDAPTSATSSSAVPRRAGQAEISADWGYFGQIQADQIESGSVLTHLLDIGSFIELDGANSYITIFGDAEHTQPLVQLRPDGSVFRGQVIADDVSVLNGLVLQGLLSHLAQSAGLTLDASVKDPDTAPTLTAGRDSLQAWPVVPDGYIARGLHWDGGQWLRLIRRSSDGIVKVQKIPTNYPTGSVTETTLASTPSSLDVNGITKVGTNWYVAIWDTDAPFGLSGIVSIRKYSTAGALVTDSDNCFIYAGTKRPAVGTDGTNVLIAGEGTLSGEDDVVVVVNPSTLAGGARWAIPGTPPANFSFVGKDNFDFGASRVVVQGETDAHVYTLAGTTLTEVSAKSFSTYGSTRAGGFAWDGTRFVSFHTAANTSLYKYSGYYPAASEKAWVTYSDTDTASAKHTKDSPPTSVTLLKRQYVQVALPPAPSGAATPKVYAGLATALPADTALLLRPETVTTRNLIINPATAGGTALGAGDSNTFGAGTPAWIKSQNGGFELYGDGILWAPKLKVYATKASRQGSAFNIGSGATAPVNMNTFDGSGTAGTTPYYHWDSTNRCWVIDVAGVYSFSGGLNLAGNATGRREVSIRINGASALFPWTRLPTVDANDVHINVARSKLPLLAGDTVDLGVFQNSAVSLDAVSSWLAISRDGELAA